MRVLAALAAAVALAGCGSERSAVTAGGRVVGDNLTVYASVPDPARGVGRDMVDASKLAIAQAGGKVGDFGINFVAVDEGSLGEPDPPRVAGAAAEEAIRDPQMIAVVGAVRSDTAMTSLPLFNAAGILLVSPGAGYAGFTAPVAAGEPDRWYPSGRPTFARVIEDDTEQARALLRAAGRGKVAIEGEVGKVASEQVEALQEAGGDRIVEDLRRADAVIYVGSELRAAKGVAESLTREAPSATLVFGDELTRAGLPRRLEPLRPPPRRLRHRRSRAGLRTGVRGRLRAGVRPRARSLRRADLARHAGRARRARRGRPARQPAPRRGRALPRVAPAPERLLRLPDARRRAGVPVTAHEIIDAARYMVLATADEDGVPWASPVWFAPDGYTRFLWVSREETRHSRNLAVRQQLSIVIFDSRAPIGTGEGVYMDAVAEQLGEPEEAIGIFSRRSVAQGGSEWTVADVSPPAELRLYLATATEQWLGRRDRRQAL